MVVGTLLGASLIVKGVWDFYMEKSGRNFKRYLEDEYDLEVRKVESRLYGCDITFLLPKDLSFTQFLKKIDIIEQNTYSHIECRKINGRLAQMKIGKKSLNDCFYTEDLPFQGLGIPLMTPFGLRMLDFADETSCHVLLGGASRMGKTALIRLITTHLMRATEGNVRIVLCDNKINDLYMFKNIPQIKIAETVIEAETQLEIIVDQIRARKEMLKEYGDVVDIKQFREKYPHIPVDPIFIIIDEFGRYADSEEIQLYVTEIAETAGYLDVHLILAAQRPDASEVLAPRIKANIVTRIAFSTSDATNSNIILGSPDAAYLGKIQGRAILLDGVMYTVQVPYINPEYAVKLLNPYRKVVKPHDQSRPTNNQSAQEVQSVEQRSNSETDLLGCSESDSNHQPYLKEIIERLAYHPDTTP